VWKEDENELYRGRRRRGRREEPKKGVTKRKPPRQPQWGPKTKPKATKGLEQEKKKKG
jgi:hypothetical protein